MLIPDRLAALAERIENGDAVTQVDVDRVATLQAFDLAQMGRQFVEETLAREKEADNEFFGQFRIK